MTTAGHHSSHQPLEKGQHGYERRTAIANPHAQKKRAQKKYHLPVIGHFADSSIEFSSILEAEMATGINYTLIFEACIGKFSRLRTSFGNIKKVITISNIKPIILMFRILTPGKVDLTDKNLICKIKNPGYFPGFFI